MKQWICTFWIAMGVLPSYGAHSLDSALYQLDQTMQEKQEYMEQKEADILICKHQLKTPGLTLRQTYEINNRLYHKYKTYLPDSAISYILQNQAIAQKLNDAYWESETQLQLASLFNIRGMYREATDILLSMDINSFDKYRKMLYYETFKQLYRNQAHNNIYEANYLKISDQYRDSLLAILDPEADFDYYQMVYAEKLAEKNRLDEAKQILFDLMNRSPQVTHLSAVVQHALAMIYKKEQNQEAYNTSLALSSIADMKNAIKENASLQFLAISLFEAGDIKRAYKYIHYSMEDAVFCNAFLRTSEISAIYPIIDAAYKEKTDKQQKQLRMYLILTSSLSIFLIILTGFVYKQMQKLKKARREISTVNRQLKELNEQLQTSNNNLSESNRIKEEYIGHFLSLCLSYINKLENYRKTLNKKALEHKLEDLFRILQSKNMIEEEFTELYHNFDTTFLHLFPSFVEDFNALLLPEERFVLKQDELLNVEMRIFALIRLGITDRSRIADFLRYSNQTIYNYLSKMKSKSRFPRENFEKMIMKIGIND
ncbi:MAG: DUF6377 domain-containing protein [Dysgonamonadaceae bacterium]|jgi:hypothetical protein|nr:DUF6377 domain-containing protein [Dysgonamonadaceae bacterium]